MRKCSTMSLMSEGLLGRFVIAVALAATFAAAFADGAVRWQSLIDVLHHEETHVVNSLDVHSLPSCRKVQTFNSVNMSDDVLNLDSMSIWQDDSQTSGWDDVVPHGFS